MKLTDGPWTVKKGEDSYARQFIMAGETCLAEVRPLPLGEMNDVTELMASAPKLKNGVKMSDDVAQMLKNDLILLWPDLEDKLKIDSPDCRYKEALMRARALFSEWVAVEGQTEKPTFADI